MAKASRLVARAFSFAETVRRSPAARTASVGEEAVLLQLDRGTYFTLNSTASWIWNLIGESGATLGELRDSIVARFEVEPEEARRDLEEILDELVAESLLLIDRTG